MTYRVTNAVTHHGHYYANGDLVENPSSEERSLSRIFGWETVSDPTADVGEPFGVPDFGGKRKPELVQLAQDRGLDASGLTKNELIELLTE